MVIPPVNNISQHGQYLNQDLNQRSLECEFGILRTCVLKVQNVEVAMQHHKNEWESELRILKDHKRLAVATKHVRRSTEEW